MTGTSRTVVAALGGCIVGAAITAHVVTGQGQQAQTPVSGKLSHISFAVADVEKTAKAFGAVFGIPVPKVQEYKNIPWGPHFPGKMMHGKLVAFMINGVQFEFLQGFDGDSPWGQHVAKSGDGVHHIGFSVEDVATARKYLESKGGQQTQAFAEWASYVDMHAAGLPITFEVTPLKMPASVTQQAAPKQ